MNRVGLWITTLSGPSQTGGKLGPRVGRPPQAGSDVVSEFLGHVAPRLPVEYRHITWRGCGEDAHRACWPGSPQAAKIPGPDPPRPPGRPPWWMPAGPR